MRRTLSVRRRRNKERDEYETESYRFDRTHVCPHIRGQRASDTRRFASAGQFSWHRYVPAGREHWAKSRPMFLPSHYLALGPPIATARRSSLLRAADTWDWPRITKVGRSPTGSLHTTSRPSCSNTGWDNNTVSDSAHRCAARDPIGHPEVGRKWAWGTPSRLLADQARRVSISGLVVNRAGIS
jgi:hypothetical protein